MSSVEDTVNLVGIPEFYAGKSIFITGATGFMGKVLVEKLLRDCPDLNCLYLLIRKKKGLEPAQRKQDYFSSELFEKLRNSNPQQFEKIRIIGGAIHQEKLGISDDDRTELIANVNVIFHLAATVRFDQPLRDAVEINTAGTQRVLQLAEEMRDLKVLAHISTTYSQCNEEVLEERSYPAPHDPIGIIHTIRSLDHHLLEEITPKLLSGFPNTYSYTKALTEGLVQTFNGKIPIIVCRPSIVVAMKSDPLPGWVEGINGATGMLIGAARGVIRSMHCTSDYSADIVPVDTTINAIIVAAWDRALKQNNQIDYINVCLSPKALPTWGGYLESAKRIFYEYPSCKSLWYPDGSVKNNYYHHLLAVLFLHYLPAYFIDMMLFLVGQKPFLVRVQKKVSMGLRVLQYYTTNIWKFKNEKLENLPHKLSPHDRERFDLTVDQINWETYMYNLVIGTRIYILKESPETIPKARKFLRRLYILDCVTKFVLFTLVFWFLCNLIL